MNFINDTPTCHGKQPKQPCTTDRIEAADVIVEPDVANPSPVLPTEKRRLTVRRMPGLSTHDEIRPCLSFGGLFLKKYGFFLGKKLTVSMEVNKITITVDDPGEGPKEMAKEESAKRSILTMREIGYRLMLTQNYLAGSQDADPGQQPNK